MGRNIFDTEPSDVVECFCQSGRTYIIGCTGFKLKRKFIESCFLKRDMLYHLPSTLIRRQTIEPFLFSVKNTDTGRSIYFMSRKNKKVRIEFLYIHFQVRNRLSRIHQERHPVCMGCSNHLFNRIDRSQHIGNLGYTDNLRPFRKQFFIFIQQ